MTLGSNQNFAHKQMLSIQRTGTIIILVLGMPFERFGEETSSPTPLKIGAGQVDKYHGQEMIVTGKAAQVSFGPQVLFLNLERPFPYSPCTVVVVFSSSTNQFGNIYPLGDSHGGKNVEAKGKITNFHDRPEIISDNTDQLRVCAEINEDFSPFPR